MVVQLYDALTKLWGDEDHWPVQWEDITPSIDVWLRDMGRGPVGGLTEEESTKMATERMVQYVLECVAVLADTGEL